MPSRNWSFLSSLNMVGFGAQECVVPDGVTSSQTDPLGNGAVLLLGLGQLDLGAERLVALYREKEVQLAICSMGSFDSVTPVRDQGFPLPPGRFRPSLVFILSCRLGFVVVRRWQGRGARKRVTTYRHFDCLCWCQCRDVVGDVFLMEGKRGLRKKFEIFLLCGQMRKPCAKEFGPGLTRKHKGWSVR